MDVVVYLCSVPLDEDEHRSIATDIALAVSEGAEAERVNRFFVDLWTDEGGEIAKSRSLKVDDFQLFLWDHESADNKWDVL